MQEFQQILIRAWNGLSAGSLSGLLLSVAILLSAAMLVRMATRHFRDKTEGSAEQRRTSYLAVRNTVIGTAIVLLLIIWGGKLQNFALSIAALAAGVAIAGKEFFMSLLGSLLRALARPYSVGDLIEVNGMRGEVIQIDLMTTRLLEQGPTGYGTSRTFEFPNMMLLQMAVRRISRGGTFGFEFIRIPIEPGPELVDARAKLAEAATRICSAWIDEADAYFRHMAGKQMIALPNSQPVVLLEPIDPHRTDLVLRFPCPEQRKLFVSQDIIGEFYRLHYAPRPAAAPNAAASNVTEPNATEPKKERPAT